MPAQCKRPAAAGAGRHAQGAARAAGPPPAFQCPLRAAAFACAEICEIANGDAASLAATATARDRRRCAGFWDDAEAMPRPSVVAAAARPGWRTDSTRAALKVMLP